MKGRLGILMLSMCIFSAASALASSPPASDAELVIIEAPPQLVQPLALYQPTHLEVVGLQPREVVLMAAPPLLCARSITPQPHLAWNNRRAYLAPDYRRWHDDANLLLQSYYLSYQLRRIWQQRSINKRGSYQDQLLFFSYKPLRYSPTIPRQQIT